MDASVQDFLDAIAEPAALVDEAGSFLAGNAAYAAATRPPERGEAAAASLAYGPEADAARARAIAALAGAAHGACEYELPTDPPCHARIEVARLGGAILARYRDTTAERRAVEEAARLAARFAAIRDASPDAMIGIDATGRVLDANEAVETLFGYAPAELIGANVALLMPEVEARRHDGWIAAFLETGRARIIGRERIVEGRRKDGAVLPVRLTVREAEIAGERVFVGILRDVSDVRRAREALDRSETSFELALEAGRLGSFDIDLTHGAIRADARFRAVFGFAPDAAITRADLAARLVPEDVPRLEDQVRAATRGGALDLEVRARRLDGAEVWIAVRGRVACRDGAMHLMGVVADITERKEDQARRVREERDRYVIGEMRHRIKNLFTMVGAILNLSLRDRQEAIPYKRAVESRLAALEAAQARLAESGSRATTLQAIVAGELEPFRGRMADIHVTGGAVAIDGQAAQILAMIVHELSTNAAKYGALSAAHGRIAVSCARAEDRIVFTWREEGGPPVRPPTHAGFGTTVIRRMAERFLDAAVETRFEPSGLIYRLSMPASEVTPKSTKASVN
jgi:PAS domain S-box-containing protein